MIYPYKPRIDYPAIVPGDSKVPGHYRSLFARRPSASSMSLYDDNHEAATVN